MTYLEANKHALKALEQFYPTKNLPQAFSDDPKGFGSDVRVAGVRCSKKGCYVTGRNLAFWNFGPEVQCYNCSHE